MSKDNTELSNKLVKAGADIKPSNNKLSVKQWFEKNQYKLSGLVGSQKEASRLFLVFMNALNRNPDLLQCTKESLMSCLYQCAEMRLFPGPMQECAFLPFKNKKLGISEAAWVPMYQGLVKLAFNGGAVKSLGANVVYDSDQFEIELGTNPRIKHVPYYGTRKNRGERKCVYAWVKTIHDELQIVVLSMDQIEAVRDRSPSGKWETGNSAWNNGNPDDYDAMARKTALKNVLKFVPKSVELAEAIHRDNIAGAEKQDPIDLGLQSELDKMQLGEWGDTSQKPESLEPEGQNEDPKPL